MQHYFDDIFTRHVQPKSNKASPFHFRRSSTTRSIGARSDFNDATTNGDDEEPRSAVSAQEDSPEEERKRVEANNHIAHYVSEQLQKVRSNQSMDVFEQGDEFEAQLDEHGHA